TTTGRGPDAVAIPGPIGDDGRTPAHGPHRRDETRGRPIHARHRRRTADAARDLRLRRVSRRTEAGDRRAAGGAVGAGGLPDGRGQEPLLPAPRAVARRPDRGGLAVDRPDEGPGRFTRAPGPRRGAARL